MLHVHMFKSTDTDVNRTNRLPIKISASGVGGKILYEMLDYIPSDEPMRCVIRAILLDDKQTEF